METIVIFTESAEIVVWHCKNDVVNVVVVVEFCEVVVVVCHTRLNRL